MKAKKLNFKEMQKIEGGGIINFILKAAYKVGCVVEVIIRGY